MPAARTRLIPGTDPTAILAVVLAALVLLCWSGTVLAATETRTYQLNNRPAQDVAHQLRDLYPVEEVALTARGNQLIARGYPQVLDEIGTLIGTMDVAPRQLRITVRSGQHDNVQRRGGGVSAHGGVVSIQGQSRTTTTRRDSERQLMIQDGQSAHIHSGQVRTLPVVLQGGRNPAVLLQQVETRQGFVVTPQVISEAQIELNIMAFEDDPRDAIPGYDTEAVVTIRRVAAGEWVELGSARTTQQGRDSGITYQTSGGQQANQRFEVKVEVLR
ncbi:secretin N-terminal domain-containing protein [uncultured Marinobacter sp.]|uniref:secretin N-terminal domain-containing protein n=1 Tax=uncultured Marinobacter sp. TaxID=187379 RepID=UPI0030D9AAFA